MYHGRAKYILLGRFSVASELIQTIIYKLQLSVNPNHLISASVATKIDCALICHSERSEESNSTIPINTFFVTSDKAIVKIAKTLQINTESMAMPIFLKPFSLMH